MADAETPLHEIAWLPMEEAIVAWRRKLPLDPDEFAKLEGEARSLAFTVAGVAAMDMLMDIQAALEQALTDGITQQEFEAIVQESLQSRGWQGFTPHHLDVIFRNNISGAYAAGRFKQMTNPEILKSRPYWMYDAVNDQNTRPSHLALDGTVRRADDRFWNTYYPPNGHRCRCDVVTLSPADVERLGLTVGEGIPTNAPVIDEDWAHNAAQATWQPDLAKYPGPFRKQLEDRLNQSP